MGHGAPRGRVTRAGKAYPPREAAWGMTDGGHLVLVFDDGTVADRETVLPVLAAADVPAVFAVVPTWLGADGHLDAEDVRMLDEAGHEIAAHGRRHRYLQGHGLARDAAAGDDRLSLEGGHVFPGEAHGVLAGDAREVVAGERAERVEVADTVTVDGSAAVVLERPLDGAFAGTETVVRPTEDTVHDEVVGVRDALRALGIDPGTFVFPYDAADVRAWTLAREHYDVVANAAVRSLPNPPSRPLTDLRRWYLETDHLAPPDLADYLDAVAEGDGLGVLAGHAAWDTVTPERVRRVLAAARERDIRVTTFERIAE